jgi:hypothetical protein
MMTQQNRIILVSVVISVVLAFFAGFLGGRLATSPTGEKPTAAVIRAQRFQLLDARGHLRGSFEVDPQGVARLVLNGQNGTPLVSLAADPQGAANIQLSDAKGQDAVMLKTIPQGQQTVALFHDGQARLALQVQNNGNPAINLYDQNKRLIAMGLNGQGDSHLTFFGENQQKALQLICKQTGDRNLTIDSKDGMPRIVLGLKNNQKAALGLFDRQGKTRVALMDEPSLFLLKNGKMIRTLH